MFNEMMPMSQGGGDNSGIEQILKTYGLIGTPTSSGDYSSTYPKEKAFVQDQISSQQGWIGSTYQSPTAENYWIQYEFDKPIKLYAVLADIASASPTSTKTCVFNILVSNDGINYTNPCDTGSLYQSHAYTRRWNFCPLPSPIVCKYVKLVYKSVSGSNIGDGVGLRIDFVGIR